MVPSMVSAEAFDWDIGARYRAQKVNDTRLGDAFASTLKLRLSGEVSLLESLTLTGSVDHVHAFNEGHYNDSVVPLPTSPITDPAVTSLSELSFTYASDEFALSAGRLVLSHDNERHVGTEEYWQTRQTFDGIELRYSDGFKYSVSYSYIRQANRYFSKRAKPLIEQPNGAAVGRSAVSLGVHEHNTHLLHTNIKLSRGTDISGYAYFIENETVESLSNITIGGRFALSRKPSRIKYDLVVEGALQQDYGNNPLDYRAFYALVEAKVQYKSHQFGLSVEHVGEDNNRQFTTALGSNHKFGGWADVFWGYGTFVDITDMTTSYKGRKGKLRWRINHHQFFSDQFDIHIGNELDIEVAYRYTRKWEGKLVFARYFVNDGLVVLPRTSEDITSAFFSVSYNL